MGLRFYSNRDVALGQFLIENCFQFHNPSNNNNSKNGNNNSNSNNNNNVSANDNQKKDKHNNNNIEKENTMLDHTLSYIHRPGRIDITIHRIGDSTTATTATPDTSNGGTGTGTGSGTSGPFHLPIYMHSYCKVES